jgi:stress response protein SCP2
MNGNSKIGNESNVTQTHVFVSSNGTVTTDGDTEFYGLLYAPESTVELQGTGGGDETNFEGSIVAQTVEAQNANVDFEYDPSFQDLTLEYDLDDQPFYYLHVVEQDVRFEG